MKANHGTLINRRVKENYANVLKNMTAEEKAWAYKYEKLEYAIERSFTADAVNLAIELNPQASEATLQRIKDDVNVKQRCNPVKAESRQRHRETQRTSERANNSNNYDALDWTRSGGFTKDDDDEWTEKGITLSPEDALIEMLDAAKPHKVSIEEYLRNPKYHTQERKVGRPKKLESV